MLMGKGSGVICGRAMGGMEAQWAEKEQSGSLTEGQAVVPGGGGYRDGGEGE